MKLDLENKRVLVTGAGSGIGREIARQFAEEGANVMILGRSKTAPMVLFLASEKTASYVTGCDYCVDGGYGD